MAEPSLLGPDDPLPVGHHRLDADSPFLLICPHAGNAVPAALAGLGLPQAELDRHIGYDIGILPVSLQLADLLGAPLVYQRYSRLVVECNRRIDAVDCVAPVSDGTLVPANQGVTIAERDRRWRAIAEPYHADVAIRLQRRPTILVSMHSFTPSLRARPFQRPWQAGLCYAANRRFSECVLAALDAEGDLVVGRNEPYGVDLANDYSIPIHGEDEGVPYAEVEIRQDLITAPDGQAAWAVRMARVLEKAHTAFATGRR